MDFLKGALAGCTQQLRAFKLIPTTEKDATATVAMIGMTGSAKSTTANVIVSGGSEVKFVLAPAGAGESCTKKCFEAKVMKGGFTLKVMDTPGLCDTKEEDVLLQINLVRALHGTGDLRGVVLCLPFNEKFTPQTEQMLAYYLKLFAPLLPYGQFHVLHTFITNDILEEEMVNGITVRKLIENRNKALTAKAMLILKNTGLEDMHFRIGFSGLMGKIPQSAAAKARVNYQEVMNDYHEKINSFHSRLGVEGMANLDTKKKRELERNASQARVDLLEEAGRRGAHVLSLVTSDGLFQVIESSFKIDMQGYPLPFPPSVEAKRKNVVSDLVGRYDEMLKTAKSTNKEASKLLERRKLLQDKIRKLEEDVSALEQEEKDILGPQRSIGKEFAGSSTLELFNKYVIFPRPPIDTFKLEYVVRKCSVNIHNPMHEDGVEIQLCPDWFHWKEKWSCQCYLSWNGGDVPSNVEEANAKRILICEKLKESGAQIHLLKICDDEQRAISSDYNVLMQRQNQFKSQITRVGRPLVPIEEMLVIVEEIEKLQ